MVWSGLKCNLEEKKRREKYATNDCSNGEWKEMYGTYTRTHTHDVFLLVFPLYLCDEMKRSVEKNETLPMFIHLFSRIIC